MMHSYIMLYTYWTPHPCFCRRSI